MYSEFISLTYHIMNRSQSDVHLCLANFVYNSIMQESKESKGIKQKLGNLQGFIWKIAIALVIGQKLYTIL